MSVLIDIIYFLGTFILAVKASWKESSMNVTFDLLEPTTKVFVE
jgi:hypothetical protein